MPAYEIANAYIALTVKAPGVKRDVEDALGSVDSDGAGRRSGAKFSAGLAGAVGGAVASVTSSIISTVMGSVDAAVARVDTMANFPKVMQNLGYSSAEASDSIATMSNRLMGLPTSLDELTGSVQKMAPLTGSLSEATTLSLALNDALLAGGQSTAVQASAMEQYTQMLSTGKVDLVAWNSIVTAMPGQMDQLAKSILGTSANSQTLYSALQDGTVTFGQFNDAIVNLDQNGSAGFASFQEQAVAATGGIGTGFENMNTAITRGLATLIAEMQPQIDAAISGVTTAINTLVPILVGIVDWVQQNGDWLGPFAAGLGIAAAAIIAITVVTWAWNAALMVNPITWIILAIGLLIGAIILLFVNFDQVVAWLTSVVANFWTWLVGVFSSIQQWWTDVWTAISSFVMTVWNDWIVAPITAAVLWVWNTINGYMLLIQAGWNAVWTGIANFVGWVWNGLIIGPIQGAVTWLWNIINGAMLSIQSIWSSIWSGLTGVVVGVWNGILGAVEGGVNGAIDLINGMIGAVNNVAGVVGISLGTIPHVSIPRLADGATVLPRAGGTLAVLAEAGRAESVVDTGKLNMLLDEANGRGRAPVSVTQHIYPQETDPRLIGRQIGREFQMAMAGGR